MILSLSTIDNKTYRTKELEGITIQGFMDALNMLSFIAVYDYQNNPCFVRSDTVISVRETKT